MLLQDGKSLFLPLQTKNQNTVGPSVEVIDINFKTHIIKYFFSQTLKCRTCIYTVVLKAKDDPGPEKNWIFLGITAIP